MRNAEGDGETAAGFEPSGTLAAKSERDALRIGAALVRPHQRTISVDDRQERVDRKAMQVLLCLARSTGQEVTKEELFAAVWPGQAVSEDVLPVAVRTLRRALGDDAKAPRFIETIPRVGYRLIAPVRPATVAASRLLIALGALIGLATVILTIWWMSSVRVLPGAQKSNSEVANRAYQRGRYLATGGAEDRAAAVEELMAAIEADADFAAAHADLGWLHFESWQRGELDIDTAATMVSRLARQAIAADESLARAHRLDGVADYLLEWDFEAAERALGRALEIDPNDAETLTWSVQLLVSQGRLQEALAQTRRLGHLLAAAYEHDWEAYILNLQGRHRLALQRLLEQRELVASADVELQLAATYIWLDRPADAVPVYRRYLQQTGAAEEELARLDELARQPTISELFRLHLDVLEARGADLVAKAQMRALLGDEEDALSLLARAFELRLPSVVFVGVERGFETLRHRREFRVALLRLGLEAPETAARHER